MPRKRIVPRWSEARGGKPVPPVGEAEYRVVWHRGEAGYVKSKLFQTLPAAEEFARFIGRPNPQVHRSSWEGFPAYVDNLVQATVRIDYREVGKWRDPAWDDLRVKFPGRE